MTPGRCPGCGYTSPSCKLVNNHMTSCEELAVMYREDPASVLDPQSEYDRWKLEEDNPEVKAAAKAERLDRRFAGLDRARDAQAVRWNPPSILDE